eukprot:3472297-Pleurochrysis_carterae.AAC.1
MSDDSATHSPTQLHSRLVRHIAHSSVAPRLAQPRLVTRTTLRIEALPACASAHSYHVHALSRGITVPRSIS